MPTEQEILGSQQLIIEFFKGFRPELMTFYGNIEHIAKGDDSPVTQLDVAIETKLKEKLLKEFPGFGFKGEETEAVAGEYDATWYVDPIDSTASFIHGLPYCANMAGLVVGGEVVASVIYHFAADELFTAVKGKGAYKNGKKITVKNTGLNDSHVFADSYSYRNVYGFYADNKVRFAAPIGATGYFLTRLAQGSIQGVCYLRANIKPHDVVPGLLLATEAGAEAVSFTEEPFGYECSRFMLGTKDICAIAAKHRSEIMAV